MTCLINQSLPIDHLTLAEADSIFGVEGMQHRGADGHIELVLDDDTSLSGRFASPLLQSSATEDI